jgi:hypothetical protein
MARKASLPTMDALHCLGFRQDPTIVCYSDSTITFDFGILKLKATACMNLRCQQIVLFSGVIRTARTLGEVHFELPQEIESVKLCAALIAWNLDQFSEFRDIHHIDWLEDGRRNKTLLPWVREMAAWDSCPKCRVERAWLRLALNRLSNRVACLPDDAKVVFAFDGSVFSIRSDGEVIALAGQGTPWTVTFGVRAGFLRHLPKRLNREMVQISIWKAHIEVGNRIYPGTLDQFGPFDPAKLH